MGSCLPRAPSVWGLQIYVPSSTFTGSQLSSRNEILSCDGRYPIAFDPSIRWLPQGTEEEVPDPLIIRSLTIFHTFPLRAGVSGRYEFEPFKSSPTRYITFPVIYYGIPTLSVDPASLYPVSQSLRREVCAGGQDSATRHMILCGLLLSRINGEPSTANRLLCSISESYPSLPCYWWHGDIMHLPLAGASPEVEDIRFIRCQLPTIAAKVGSPKPCGKLAIRQATP